MDQLSSSDSRALLGAMLRKVVAGLSSEQPLVLVLEDLEHLDRETWSLLEELSRELAGWPVLLWITSRKDMPLDPSAGAGLARMVLGPPGDEAIRMRIRRIARLYSEEVLDETLVDELRQLAEDNPRFAEELVRFLGESGRLPGFRPENETPPTFHELISCRLQGIPLEDREVLQAGAVIGQLFAVGLLTRVTRRERQDVEEVLQRTRRRGMVEPIGPGLYAFRHELLPAILYSELAAEAARTLHERIAAQLEAAHPEDRARFLEELAHHYSRAGSTEKALRYLEALADRMEAGHHFRAAISHMQAASSLLADGMRTEQRRRIEVLLRIAELAIPAMDFELGRQVAEQALALAQKTRQERKVPQCFFLLGKVSLAAGRFDEALNHLERALKLVQGLRDRTLSAGIYGALGETYHKNGDLTRAIHYIGQAVGLAGREGDTVLAGKLLLLQASCQAGIGSFAEAERSLEKAMQLAGRGYELVMRCAVLKTSSLIEFFRRDLQAALAACLEGAEVAQAIGNVAEEVIFLHNAGDSLMRMGDLARAHHYLGLSHQLCVTHGLTRNRITNEILLGYVEVMRQGPAAPATAIGEGLATMRQALTQARQLHLVWEQIQAQLLLGEVALTRHELDEAREQITAAAREAKRIHLCFAVQEAEAALSRLKQAEKIATAG